VSGGSSSGSAVAVALGIADIGLGTDTAGSGRIPAAFQGVVGIKPTRGLIPTRGVVPACRSLDCVSVFAASLSTAEQAIALMTGVDAQDPTSRAWPSNAPLAAPPAPRVAVPSSDQLVGLSPPWMAAFERAAEALADAGAQLVPVDLAPFLSAGRLLYDGAFVAERHAAVGAYVDAHRDSVDPTVGAIISAAAEIPAHRLVADTERLELLRLQANAAIAGADALLVPTAPEHPSIEQVAADPVAVNGRLGTYSTFCSLLDLCAVAVPAPGGPASFGVTVVGRAFADRAVADVARLLTTSPAAPHHGGPPAVPLAVFGAHMTGEPLNPELTRRGGRFLRAASTAPDYRLYALPTYPPKPGLVRVPGGGAAIEAEVWLLPPLGLADLVAELPAPMALGRVRLGDGSTPIGFLCEPDAISAGTDITLHGGWRPFLRAARQLRDDPEM
jgi:allophanate hydrolase